MSLPAPLDTSNPVGDRPEHKKDRFPLKGHRAFRLMHELARGEVTQAELSRRHRVTPAAILFFARRHADQIEAIRADLQNEFAGLWIADKKARLAELQALAENIATRLTPEFAQALDEWVDDSLDEDERRARRDTVVAAMKDEAAWARLLKDVLRAGAEELGQIPTKANIEVNTTVVDYRIEGVDMGQLR